MPDQPADAGVRMATASSRTPRLPGASSDLLPRWTSYASTDGTGRDPLGLSRVAHALTDRLLTGIITQTDRARYFSFFTWCLWHIHQHERPTTTAQFVAAFQRRETAMSVATLMLDRNRHVVGSELTLPLLDAAGDEINTQVGVLPASRLGGYGQYYKGCIGDLGLRASNEHHLDCVDGPVAVALAEAVEAVLAKTPYIAKELFRQGRIPLAELKRSAPRMQLYALDESICDDERQLLIDLFWNEGPHAKSEAHERTQWRRRTLTLLLSLLDEYRQAGIPVWYNTLSEQLIESACGERFLLAIDPERADQRTPVHLDPALEPAADLWRQFAVHGDVTYAYEFAMLALSRTIGCADGMDLVRARDAIAAGGCLERLAQMAGGDVSRPHAVVSRPQRAARRPAEIIAAVADGDEDVPALMAGALALLGTIAVRWRGSQDPSVLKVAGLVPGDLWLGSALALTEPWRQPSCTWSEAIDALLRQVVATHDRVTIEKQVPESPWLRRMGDGIRADREVEPHRRSSRWSQAVSICRDLGLVTISDDQAVQTTAAGRRLAARCRATP
jgi:hypothetical protein